MEIRKITIRFMDGELYIEMVSPHQLYFIECGDCD